MIEDDGSSSDCGMNSSHDGDEFDREFDRLSRSMIDDNNDLEAKIRFFFQRIEQDEALHS